MSVRRLLLLCLFLFANTFVLATENLLPKEQKLLNEWVDKNYPTMKNGICKKDLYTTSCIKRGEQKDAIIGQHGVTLAIKNSPYFKIWMDLTPYQVYIKKARPSTPLKHICFLDCSKEEIAFFVKMQEQVDAIRKPATPPTAALVSCPTESKKSLQELSEDTEKILFHRELAQSVQHAYPDAAEASAVVSAMCAFANSNESSKEIVYGEKSSGTLYRAGTSWYLKQEEELAHGRSKKVSKGLHFSKKPPTVRSVVFYEARVATEKERLRKEYELINDLHNAHETRIVSPWSVVDQHLGIYSSERYPKTFNERFSNMHTLEGEVVALLAALQKIHAMGIAHRDIRLDNIYVNEGGRLVLGDFGEAIREGEAISGTRISKGYVSPYRLLQTREGCSQNFRSSSFSDYQHYDLFGVVMSYLMNKYYDDTTEEVVTNYKNALAAVMDDCSSDDKREKVFTTYAALVTKLKASSDKLYVELLAPTLSPSQFQEKFTLLWQQKHALYPNTPSDREKR
ncbi:MAG: hypothetical protein HQK52_10555 [Oligoflexia bacterium]|nr:hypothetical protein [Oligoflexia bacterium]